MPPYRYNDIVSHIPPKFNPYFDRIYKKMRPGRDVVIQLTHMTRKRLPRNAAGGEDSYTSLLLEAISMRHLAVNLAGVIAPRSSPLRVRTETVPFSISRSPTTSI